MSQNREESARLDAALDLTARANPDALEAIGGADVLLKYSKGGIGQKQALLGQLTAQVADKYRKQRMELDVAEAELNATTATRRLDLAERAQGFDEQKTEADIASLAPRFLKGPDGNSYVYTPASRQLPQPVTKSLIPAPGGKEEDIVTDANGQPAYKLKWNGAKGEYEKFDVRPKSTGLGDLLLPQGGANSPGGTGGPANNPLTNGSGAGAGTKGKYEAGKVYRDAKGQKARYNADGSWTPVQ